MVAAAITWVLLAGCGIVGSGGGQEAGGPGARPPVATFHVVVWNRAQRPVDVHIDATGSGMGSSSVGAAAGCEATVFDSMMADTWELRIDGQHLVGTADRPDLSASRGIRELTVEVDVTADGTVRVRSTHPGAAPGVDHFALACPGGSPSD